MPAKKMAASNPAHGYQCEFIDSVAEDFLCKQCGLVARSLTITSCCGESYCSACIQAVLQDSKPCPKCGAESFSTFPQVRDQRQISALKVHCTLKEKGCCWWPQNKQEDSEECAMRGYVCPYCAFRATYQFVTEIHWPVATSPWTALTSVG